MAKSREVKGGYILGEGTEEDPAVLLQDRQAVRTIEDTTLGDKHVPRRHLIAEIAKTHEDWGDGFFVNPEPVHIQRGPDGSILKITPFSEIPGVEYTHKEEDEKAMQVESKEVPVPLNRKDRTKLVAILAGRMCMRWKTRGPGDPRYNPYRDGIPDVPAGSPENLQPLPATKLYPATDGQILEWTKRFIGERATVINKKRFGGGIQDLVLRIE